MDWAPKPFRSLDSWFSHEGLIKIVKKKWRSLGYIQISEKFKALRKPLREWNKMVFRNIDDKIKSLEVEIMKINEKVEEEYVDNILMERLHKWYDRRECYWKQLSRLKLAR